MASDALGSTRRWPVDCTAAQRPSQSCAPATSVEAASHTTRPTTQNVVGLVQLRQTENLAAGLVRRSLTVEFRIKSSPSSSPLNARRCHSSPAAWPRPRVRARWLGAEGPPGTDDDAGQAGGASHSGRPEGAQDVAAVSVGARGSRRGGRGTETGLRPRSGGPASPAAHHSVDPTTRAEASPRLHGDIGRHAGRWAPAGRGPQPRHE